MSEEELDDFLDKVINEQKRKINELAANLAELQYEFRIEATFQFAEQLKTDGQVVNPAMRKLREKTGLALANLSNAENVMETFTELRSKLQADGRLRLDLIEKLNAVPRPALVQE